MMQTPIVLDASNVGTAVPGLPRLAQIAFAYAARIRRGTLDVTLPDGRLIRFGGAEPGPPRS